MSKKLYFFQKCSIIYRVYMLNDVNILRINQYYIVYIEQNLYLCKNFKLKQ